MINFKINDGIAEISMDDGGYNVVGEKMLGSLEAAINSCQNDKRVTALIICSGRDSVFSSGADLVSLYHKVESLSPDESKIRMHDFLERINKLYDLIDQLPFPTISVVNGICFGGGFELVLTTDLVIVESCARFAFPELRLGFYPCFGGMPRMKRDFPEHVTRHLLFTGTSISGKRFHELGLATQCVPLGEGYRAALGLAKQVSKFSPLAYSDVKYEIKKPIDSQPEIDGFIEMFFENNSMEKLKEYVETKTRLPYIL